MMLAMRSFLSRPDRDEPLPASLPHLPNADDADGNLRLRYRLDEKQTSAATLLEQAEAVDLEDPKRHFQPPRAGWFCAWREATISGSPCPPVTVRS